MVWYGVVWYGVVMCAVVWCVVWCDVVWYGVVMYGVVMYGMVRYGMVYGMLLAVCPKPTTFLSMASRMVFCAAPGKMDVAICS